MIQLANHFPGYQNGTQHIQSYRHKSAKNDYANIFNMQEIITREIIEGKEITC